ncbi:DUF4229 domain-containing protein [Streptomyces sp. NBC_01451]|uniref:DUF4229 domain-containing protein n=1 Tax=Streptomyces sp. NBC_01451 TaxID=2903872 RepID=UPI002E357BAF|nr:DUF4229 domain-containing protein [Streptomyces sp. NBC_01451]
MLRYTLMRLGILVACLLVVWGLVQSGIAPRGLGDSNGMWIILLSLVISAPISFVALRKERDRASVQIVERVDRVKANLDANRSQEDEAVDEAARAQAEVEIQAETKAETKAEAEVQSQGQPQGQPS